MVLRKGMLSLVGGITLTGAAVAKPPGEPTPPLVDGREPTPIAREFHTTDHPPAAFGTITLPTSRAPGKATPSGALPLAELVTGVWSEMFNRLTMPLGTVPVRE
jgi:hypothetical protein